jgi:Fe2+ or Zn2+ uptake regulation protein
MPQLIHEAATTVRSKGGRMTAQRRLILETLERLGGHPTAAEVCAAAREADPALNPSTVYRTLDLLEAAGLVQHRHLDAGPNNERCERYDPATSGEHHHFICIGCGQVIEFTSPELDAAKTAFAAQHGAEVTQASLTLYGACHDCRDSGS